MSPQCFYMNKNLAKILLFVVPLMSCSDGKNPSHSKQKIKINVGIEKGNSADSTAPMSPDSPLFLGLNIIGSGVNFTPQQVAAGDTYIDLPTDKPITIKARVLRYNINTAGQVHYYISDVTKDITIKSTALDVALDFPALKEALPLNVYGVVVNNGAAAQAWSVAIKDPLTSAPVTLPGVNSLTQTDTSGSFSFKYLFAQQNVASEAIDLEFTSPSGQKIIKSIALPTAKRPAFSAGYLNLSGTAPVMLGKSADDFDGDGYPNLAEEAMGTNPFSVNIGACVAPTQVLKGYSYTCPDGTTSIGLLEQTPGLNCWDAAGDVNADGVHDYRDCMGATGATGATGPQGSTGPQGPTGPQGIPGTAAAGGGGGLYSGSTYIGGYFYNANTPYLTFLDGSSVTNYVELKSASSLGKFTVNVKTPYYTNTTCTGSVYQESYPNNGTSVLFGELNYLYGYLTSTANTAQVIKSFRTGSYCNVVGKTLNKIKTDGSAVFASDNTNNYWYSANVSSSFVLTSFTMSIPDVQNLVDFDLSNGKIYVAYNTTTTPSTYNIDYCTISGNTCSAFTNITNTTEYNLNITHYLDTVTPSNSKVYAYNKDSGNPYVYNITAGASAAIGAATPPTNYIKSVVAYANDLYVIYTNSSWSPGYIDKYNGSAWAGATALTDIYICNQNCTLAVGSTNMYIHGNQNNDLIISTNTGSTWTKYTGFQYNAPYFNPLQNSIYSFSSSSNGGIKWSTNNGINWYNHEMHYIGASIYSMFGASGNIYASTNKGVLQKQADNYFTVVNNPDLTPSPTPVYGPAATTPLMLPGGTYPLGELQYK